MDMHNKENALFKLIRDVLLIPLENKFSSAESLQISIIKKPNSVRVYCTLNQ